MNNENSKEGYKHDTVLMRKDDLGHILLYRDEVPTLFEEYLTMYNAQPYPDRDVVAFNTLDVTKRVNEIVLVVQSDVHCSKECESIIGSFGSTKEAIKNLCGIKDWDTYIQNGENQWISIETNSSITLRGIPFNSLEEE